jgi:hypothetical protein
MSSLWLSLSLLAALASDPPRPAPPPAAAVPHTVTVHLADPEHVAPFGLEGVEAEAERLFAPLGVRLDGATQNEAAVQVILLAADRSQGGLKPQVMGAVSRSVQNPAVVWILVPSVRRALGGTSEQWPSLPNALVARALGRILAHEIVHLIAPELPHAQSGLMGPTLGRAQLLGERQALDPALGPTVRQRLASGRLRPPIA